MSRRFIVVTALILLSLIPAGCSGGSYKIVVGDIKAAGSSITGSYRGFTGEYFKQVKFEEGRTVRFSYSNHTISGQLTAKVIDPEGWPIIELSGQDSTVIQKTGKYKIVVTGRNHEGDFMVSWE